MLYKIYAVIKDLQPERIIINGDFLDCYSISRFDKDPLRSLASDDYGNQITALQNELNTAHFLLSELRDIAQESQIDYVEGNHEFRLKRYVLRNTPEFQGLHLQGDDLPILSLPKLLDLDSLEINYIGAPTGEGYTRVGNLVVGHFNRVSKHSAYTAKALIEDKGVSIMQGHTHRAGVHYKTTMGGTLVGYENFCTCDTNPDYVSNPNWQQGYSIIEYDDTGSFSVHQVLLS